MDLELKVKSNGKLELYRVNYRQSYSKDQWKTRGQLNEEGHFTFTADTITIVVDSNFRCLSPSYLASQKWHDVDELQYPFNSAWELSIMENYHYPQYGGSPLSLGFSSDTLFGGYAGCNSFGGSAEMDSTGGFKVKSMNSTLLYCEPMDLEERYTAKLFEVRSYKIPSPRQMVLYDSLGNAILFYKRSLVLN